MLKAIDNYSATVWFVIREAREDGSPIEASQALPLLQALDLAEQWTKHPYDNDGSPLPTNAGIALHQDCQDAVVWLFFTPKQGWMFLCGGDTGNCPANDFVKILRQHIG